MPQKKAHKATTNRQRRKPTGKATTKRNSKKTVMTDAPATKIVVWCVAIGMAIALLVITTYRYKIANNKQVEPIETAKSTCANQKDR